MKNFKKMLVTTVLTLAAIVGLVACSGGGNTVTYEGDMNGQKAVFELTHKDDLVTKCKASIEMDLGQEIPDAQKDLMSKELEKAYGDVEGLEVKADIKGSKAMINVTIDLEKVDSKEASQFLGGMMSNEERKLETVEKALVDQGFTKK